jgi:site-specific recombinase XerC
MFDVAIDSKLRGCDVVKLRVGDVTVGGQVRQRSMVIQQKTGTPVSFEMFGTHSLRRTKASLIYKRTGNLQAVQILLGHRKIESTVRYLGVDLEDALTLSEGTDV